MKCSICGTNLTQVEAKLARRLEAGVKAWTQALVSEGTSKEEVDFSMDTDAPAVGVHRLGGDPKLKVFALYAIPVLYYIFQVAFPVQISHLSAVLMISLYS